MKKIILILCLALGIGCADESDACKTASDMGFSNCNITDSSRLVPTMDGCHREETVSFSAQATNPAGRPVNITICCRDWPTSCTIRN